MDTADQVLAEPYVSYDVPLAKARQWIKTRNTELLGEAVKLLSRLHERHPHAMQIIPELALALLEQNQADEAQRVLDKCAADPMALSEELFCRCGRVLRESGDKYADLGGTPAADDTNAAGQRYTLALAQYRLAYAVRQNYYPGVNIAQLHLRLQAVGPAEAADQSHLSAARALAQELLARRQEWPRNLSERDDEVWRTATAADCHLLCEQWLPAMEHYRLARKHAACQPLHVECMHRTAEAIINCFRRLRRIEPDQAQQVLDVFGSSPQSLSMNLNPGSPSPSGRGPG